MTYLHKLAKRLSLVPATLVVVALLLSGCTEGTTHDYLGPDPNKPKPSGSYIGLSITPHDPQLVQGDSVRLQAQGWLSNGLSTPAQVTWSGAPVSADGWFRASSTGTFKVRAVATSNIALSDSVLISVVPWAGIARLDVTPSAAPLAAGTQQQFTAVALMGDGTQMYPTVQWSATGGSITSAGLFTASGEAGDYQVTAFIGDGALQGRALGPVTPPVLTSLVLDQRSMILEAGGGHQFVPSATWSNGSSTVPAIAWTATGGTISGSGVFTAGTVPGSFRVIANSAQHGKADTSTVTILPRVVSLRLIPLTALLAPEATQVVTALALRSDGTEGPIGVQWSAQGGAISLNGTYTAGAASGTYPVNGTLQALNGETLTATVHFQVGSSDETTAAPAIFVAPDTTIQTGASARFRLTAASGPVPAVNWTATGGTIDASGLYVAGAIPGAYRVIATRKSGARADTAQVTVVPVPPIQIQSFTVTPSSDIIGAGQTRQFSATLSWSDGQAHPSNITWVSGGGTITQNGLYTAGTVAGTYFVIAMCGCGAADTAAVTIPHQSAGPATLTQLHVTPSSVTLEPGNARVFTVTGVWSDGASSPPPVSYSATGGSITAAGVYLAGPVPGTYKVIATQAGGGLADTSVVTISSSGTLTQLVLNPSAVTVPKSGTQAFVVSALWSDGTTAVPSVTWTATGGTVSNDGVYTAGSTGGTYHLIVAHTGGTLADTSVITIPAGVTLSQLVLNPSTVALTAGGTQQFAVTGSWSDGSATAPSVTWNVTGGSISQAGLYTAGATTGTFRVIAVHTGGTKADTSAVTINATQGPLPPLPSSPTIIAELPRVTVNTAYLAPGGQKINVAAGGNLQSAINNAQCGDEILLAAGATYPGSYSLPSKSCATNPVHIRTAGALPPDGVRVTPATAAGFAKIVSGNGDAPLRAANGARGYRLIALEVYGTAPEYIGNIYIGGDGRDPFVASAIPGYIVLDRMYVHGLPHQKNRRCVALNGIHLAVINSYLSKCQSSDTDAQAIWSSYGPGPYKIENNFLEGTGENVMFGGSDSPSADMMPQDIEIRRNHFTKPEEWRTSGEWLIKNLFELKVGKRLLVEGNVFENSWTAGHTGFAMGFASMNQSGGAPWSQVSDLTFRKNLVRHSGAGIAIAGSGTANATLAERFVVTDNVFEDIGRLDLRSDGRMVQIIGGVKDVYISHNTFLHTPGGAANSAIYYASGATPRNTVINNVFTAGTYGIIGDAIGQGTVALAYYAPYGLFAGNVFAGSVSWSRPANNFWVSTVSSLGFDSQLRLGASSGVKGRATDGRDPGADIDALIAATAGVAP